MTHFNVLLEKLLAIGDVSRTLSKKMLNFAPERIAFNRSLSEIFVKKSVKKSG